MYLTIKAPVDVNGNKREMRLLLDMRMNTNYRIASETDATVHVSAEEFRHLAVSWEFPLNDEDTSENG